MKKVYLIESGEYSDYRVDYVVASKKVAKTICERLNRVDDRYDVSERVLIESPDDGEIKTMFYVRTDAHGTELERWTYTRHGSSEQFEDNGWAARWAAGGQSCRGHDVALKIARDKLAEVKAKEAGL